MGVTLIAIIMVLYVLKIGLATLTRSKLQEAGTYTKANSKEFKRKTAFDVTILVLFLVFLILGV